MPLHDLWLLALAGLLAILLAGALAPFETLGWWAGWFGRPSGPGPLTPGGDNPARHFVVVLSGIHSVSGASFARREIRHATAASRFASNPNSTTAIRAYRRL